MDDRGRRVQRPERQAAGERDAVVERREPGDRPGGRAGSCSIGKNVPENRNSGVIPKRKRSVELRSSRCCVAEKAAIGVAKASPVRIAAGPPSDDRERRRATPEADHHERRRSPATRGSRKREEGELAEDDAGDRDRASRASPGMVRTQMIAARIGKVDSPTAVCIACRGEQPGARNARYGDATERARRAGPGRR